MKITTFNPMLIIRDEKPAVNIFKDLGFEPRHTKEGIADQDFKDVRMEDANGFHMDIVKTTDLPREAIMAIRMNVDNLDEGIALLTKHGFESYKGFGAAHSESSDSITMVSKSKIVIKLIQHNRK